MSETANDGDGALVRAARGGDKAAFAALLTRHRPLLVALCLRSLGDGMLAEDAAQEAALQAMLGLDRLRRPERFGPWLAGIGLNVCRRWLRARPHEAWSWEALQGGVRGPEPADARPGPEEVAEAADLSARVRQAVATLPPGQRSAILLVYLSGLTQSETAALLGIEVGAVKTRLHKARRTLRRRLLADWEEITMDEKLNRRTLTKGAAGLASAATNPASPAWVPMRVADVRRPAAETDGPRHHVVILEEIGGTRRMPIWIGDHEATAIALHLENVPHPRPLTYAFAAAVLAAAGGALREVRISKLVSDTYYAEVIIAGPSGTKIVDARPSDALNLALLADAPIAVESSLLAAAISRWKPSPAQSTDGAAEIVAGVVASWEQERPGAAEVKGGA